MKAPVLHKRIPARKPCVTDVLCIGGLLARIGLLGSKACDANRFARICSLFARITRMIRLNALLGCTRRGSYSAKGRVSAF